MDDLSVQGINDTTLYAEKIYSQNFTQSSKKFILSLHYNDDNCYLFVNGTQELKFKAKDDQIINKKLCLGNVSSVNGLRVNQERQGYMEIFTILS